MDPDKLVNSYLREARRGSAQSVRAVIDRLLSVEADDCQLGEPGTYLEYAWRDILKSCLPGARPGCQRERWQEVIHYLVELAASYSPESIANDKDVLQRVEEKNREIGIKAHELARLIREREVLREGSGIGLVGDRSLFELLARAAELSERHRAHALFSSFVEPELEPIQAAFQTVARRYDYQYWPEAAAVFEAFAETHFDMRVELQDEYLEAALSVSKRSTRDFFRILDAALEHLAGDEFAGAKIALPVNSYVGLCGSLFGLTDITSRNVTEYRRLQRNNPPTQ